MSFWREPEGRSDRIQCGSFSSQALLAWRYHEHDEPEGDSLYFIANPISGAIGPSDSSECADGYFRCGIYLGDDDCFWFDCAPRWNREKIFVELTESKPQP